MVSYLEALNKIQLVAPQNQIRTIEVVKLESAVGRVLAESVFSSENVPAFNNSAMDGFAIDSEKTLRASVEQPIDFLVVGEIAAGDWLSDEQLDHAGSLAAFEIMTGAPMPERVFDAVVKVEDVDVIRVGSQTYARIQRPVGRGDHVRLAGTDIGVGEEILPAGKILTTEMILAAAACGISEVKVWRRLKVAILSTGSELVNYHEPRLPLGKIRNSTNPYLEVKLKELGLEVTNYGLVADDPQGYLEVVNRVLKSDVDLILTTGAVSMGKYDFILPLLKDLNAQIHFHKVAIRPGKPIVFAEVPVPDNEKKIPFIGMPGNPVSTAVALRFFVTPLVRGMLGLPTEVFQQAQMTKPFKKPEGLRCFYKARTHLVGGQARVEVVKQQASYLVGNFRDVDHWVIFPEEGSLVEEEQIVEFCGFGGLL